MSESDASHLGRVAKRWRDISDAWSRLDASGLYPAVDFVQLQEFWDRRYKIQVEPIHMVAWALDPKTTDQTQPDWLPLSPDMEEQVIRFIQSKFAVEDHAAIQTEWLSYRARYGDDTFSPTSPFYKQTTPRMSWLFAMSRGSKLAPFAVRLLGCIANSVPSEGAFSTLNYIHSKLRARTSPDKADKQVFCFMNSRVLQRLEDEAVKAPTLDSPEFEQLLLEMETAAVDEDPLVDMFALSDDANGEDEDMQVEDM